MQPRVTRFRKHDSLPPGKKTEDKTQIIYDIVLKEKHVFIHTRGEHAATTGDTQARTSDDQ